MQVEFTVRSYRPGDFLTLWKIDQSCFEPQIAYSQQELKRYIRWPSAFSLIAEHKTTGNRLADDTRDDLSIIGFLIADLGTPAGHIITIDVRAEARGNGTVEARAEVRAPSGSAGYQQRARRPGFDRRGRGGRRGGGGGARRFRPRLPERRAA